MKSIRIFSLLVLILMISNQLFAGGFALSGVGSRATAMGGAFRGLADDPSAMYWNPAGLGFINESSLALGGTFIMPTSSWTPTDAFVSSSYGFSAKEYEAKKELRALPNVFLTMANDSRLAYGLGVFVPYGLGSKWDAFELPGAPFVYEAGFPDEEMLSNIAIIDVHPSVGYVIMDNLSVGAGLSLFYGSIDLAQMKQLPDAPYSPLTFDMGGSGLSFGANLGVMYKPLPCISLGLSGKLPSSIPMKGEAEVLLWTPAQADGTPAMRLGGKSDIEATLKLPADLGLGIAFQAMPNLVVTADYAYTMWKRLDKVTVDMDDAIDITPAMSISRQDIVFDWKDTHRVSLGAEYKLCGNDIRAGFFFDQSPIPPETQMPTLSDVGNKFSSNLGWGRQFGKLSVDLNAQWVLFGEREIKDNERTANNYPGKYNANSVSGNIGLSYKF